jgi:RNA polymerase sigma-70 factor (ECF subfamily)
MESPGAGLMQRIQARDQQAFGALYDRLAPMLNAVLCRVLGDRQEAEEVLGETFWQVWNSAASYDPLRGPVEGWVISIGRNRALDRLRVRKRYAMHTAQYTAEGRLRAESPTAIPEDMVLRGERVRAVADALETLPKEQRLPIELAYYEGLSQTEIADRLAQPLGTIKTRVRLGLLRLRHALAPYLGEHA